MGSTPNELCEAYTGNFMGRKGVRTSLKQFSLAKLKDAGGDGFNVPEAKTKESLQVRFRRACRGHRAWHVKREASKNLGDPIGSWSCWDYSMMRGFKTRTGKP